MVNWDHESRYKLLLAVLEYSAVGNVNWEVVSQKLGAGTTASGVRQQFNKIKKSAGSDLSLGGDGAASTPSKGRKNANKSNDGDSDDKDGDDADGSDKAKGKASTKRKAKTQDADSITPSKKFLKVKAEDSEVGIKAEPKDDGDADDQIVV